MTRRGGIVRLGVLTLAYVAIGQHVPALQPPQAAAKILLPLKRFTFTIDPATPLADLLPTPPEIEAPLLPWLVDDLAKVPEIRFEKAPIAQDRVGLSDLDKLPAEEQRRRFRRAEEWRDNDMRTTAFGIAKINLVNSRGTDQFMKELLKTRPDLAGLPFLLGDACRLSKDRGVAFTHHVDSIRLVLSRGPDRDEAPAKTFWSRYEARPGRMPADSSIAADLIPAQTAALMQILGPAPKTLRLGLIKHLDALEHAETTKALARLAVFSAEEDVRDAALNALKTRPAKDYTTVLIHGLRYPWPSIVQNAATAVVRLERKDLAPLLADMLDEADPRAPAPKVIAGQKKTVVREVVRLNHHRNCLTCHAPGNPAGEAMTRSASPGVVVGSVPSPNQPLPGPFSGYDRSSSPDIVVRADATYLRQDFSLMQPVKDAAPWPDAQRFDFLVRERAVSAEDIAAYEAWRAKQGAEYRTPYQLAALRALRGLTGRDAEATTTAWRRILAEEASPTP